MGFGCIRGFGYYLVVDTSEVFVYRKPMPAPHRSAPQNVIAWTVAKKAMQKHNKTQANSREPASTLKPSSPKSYSKNSQLQLQLQFKAMLYSSY